MKDWEAPYIGIVTAAGGETCNFYLDDYAVLLMRTDSSVVKFEGPFVYGCTFWRGNIAIYKGEEAISCACLTRFRTPAYMVAVENCLQTKWETFDSIEFVGGTLKGVFPCSGVQGEKQGKTFVYSLLDDSKKYSFRIGGRMCSLEIMSSTTRSVGVKGHYLANDKVHLWLKFDEAQPLEDAFMYIQKMKSMLSFMVFRKNVGFDEIFLHHKQEGVSKLQVYLNEDYAYAEKDIYSNITFDDLGDSVGHLASVIFENEDKRRSCKINFIPESDRDAKRVSDGRIRLICSSLECESGILPKGETPEDNELKYLVEQVTRVVKNHRESPQKLSNKTYDLILSSIRNWSMSASDRFCKLYRRHADEMRTLIAGKLLPDYDTLSDEDINGFVKYRNQVTHGSHRMMSTKIAATAFILQGLVYCCILSRIGLDKSRISRLCSEGKILS